MPIGRDVLVPLDKLVLSYQDPPDTTPPTIVPTSPSNGATVSGSSVSLSANASDDTAVVGVQFKLDGSNLQTEDTSSPYSINWDTTSSGNGSHVLTATARDAGSFIKLVPMLPDPKDLYSLLHAVPLPVPPAFKIAAAVERSKS